MFSSVGRLLEERDGTAFTTLYEEIERQEDITDQVEYAIAHYLEQVAEDHLSDETKAKIRSMMRQTGELESIGDACYNMARMLKRKQQGNEDFTEEQYTHLKELMQLTQKSLTQMNTVLSSRREECDFGRTQVIEQEINDLRVKLKEQNIADVNEHRYAYTIGTTYMDIVNECERLADYVVNVVEARLGI